MPDARPLILARPRSLNHAVRGLRLAQAFAPIRSKLPSDQPVSIREVFGLLRKELAAHNLQPPRVHSPGTRQRRRRRDERRAGR